jgi:hypothetical protein
MMPRNHLRGHLTNAPGLTRCRINDGIRGDVVPNVQETSRGPHAGPVTVESTRLTSENGLGGGTANHAKELVAHTLADEERDAVVDNGVAIPAITLEFD